MESSRRQTFATILHVATLLGALSAFVWPESEWLGVPWTARLVLFLVGVVGILVLIVLRPRDRENEKD